MLQLPQRAAMTQLQLPFSHFQRSKRQNTMYSSPSPVAYKNRATCLLDSIYKKQERKFSFTGLRRRAAHNIVHLQKYPRVFAGEHPAQKHLSCLQDTIPPCKTWTSAADGYECILSKPCLLFPQICCTSTHGHHRGPDTMLRAVTKPWSFWGRESASNQHRGAAEGKEPLLLLKILDSAFCFVLVRI